MSWFEAFMISILAIGIGGGFVFFVVHNFLVGLCDENTKIIRMADRIMIIMMIVGVFLFIPVAQYGGRNLDKSDNSTRTCRFKEDGRYVCSSPCKSGSDFCSYHDEYLNDAYNNFVNGDWD